MSFVTYLKEHKKQIAIILVLVLLLAVVIVIIVVTSPTEERKKPEEGKKPDSASKPVTAVESTNEKNEGNQTIPTNSTSGNLNDTLTDVGEIIKLLTYDNLFELNETWTIPNYPCQEDWMLYDKSCYKVKLDEW